MRPPAAGESAAQLPWLWPDAHSLEVLAHPLSPATWPALRRDPAVLLLATRDRPVGQPALAPARFAEPRLLEAAVHWLRHDDGRWLDWRAPAVLPVYETALAVAHHASIIAGLTRCCDAAAAWTAGLLAPLGWFAVAAVDPEAVSACRSDPSFDADPAQTEQRHWGGDHAAVARRLARRWQLPDWLRAVVGHLELPVSAAEALGGDGALFAAVKLAVGLAEDAGYSLRLADRADEAELLARLGTDRDDLLTVRFRFRGVDLSEAFEPGWHDPRSLPGFAEMLRTKAERRRAETLPFLGPLERDVDRLQAAVLRLRDGADERLRSAKLRALAEFAAGASHEINNPLAVISGQGQYLLARAEDGAQRRSLESIIRQAQRINAILTELMQFARPSKPAPQVVALGDVVRSAVEACRGLADEAGVRLDCVGAESAVWIDADPKHLQTALRCLVRNAVEAAAPGKGWARVRVEVGASRVDVVVEDSGAGPTPAQREHLFDPFYSGRSAGRGRGLGLPTAWRLARENGGDVRHEPSAGGPTRFVLSLPPAELAAERRSA